MSGPRDTVRAWILTNSRIAVLKARLDEISGKLAKQLRGEPFERTGELERYLVEDDGQLYIVTKRLGTVLSVREVQAQHMQPRSE